MSTIGYGPLERIDGPLPQPQVYGLLAAAAAPAAGVTLVVDVDESGIERWLNGVEVYPYPPGPGFVWDTCAPGTLAVAKGEGDDNIENPQYGAFTLYLAEHCKTRKVWDAAEYRARAATALAAIESSAVATEWLTGAVMPLNPHLTDGSGDILNSGAATSAPNALVLLEQAIGDTGKLGLIHMSPALAARLSFYLALDNRTGVLRTINGTPVIADAGYSAGLIDNASPSGHPPTSGNEEWMYATGPMEIRRSVLFITPDTPEQAIDRGSGGASVGLPNTYIYRAERYYLVDTDNQFKAAVLADRCQDACTD